MKDSNFSLDSEFLFSKTRGEGAHGHDGSSLSYSFSELNITRGIVKGSRAKVGKLRDDTRWVVSDG